MMNNIIVSFVETEELDSLLLDINNTQALIQIFCANNNLEEIKQIQNYFSTNFPLANIIGSTTVGFVKNNVIHYETYHAVMITQFEKTNVTTALVLNGDSRDKSFLSGKNIAKKLIKQNTKALICFSDGINTNGEELLNGIASINEKVVVSGGMAGDNGQFQHTYVFDNQTITENGVVGVSLDSDDLYIYMDYSFNWQPIGKSLKVTKAVKNRVYEIDAMSCVDIYSKYLGKDMAKNLPESGLEFPLILKREGIEIGRVPLHKHNDGSMTFAGNIYEGEYVRFGVGNIDIVLNNSRLHAQEIIKSIEYEPEAIFTYTCMARRRFMRSYLEDEFNSFKNLGNFNGFFSYGEFFHKQKHNYLLNESITLLALSEKKKPVTNHIQKYEQNQSTFKESEINTNHVLSHLVNSVSSELIQLNDELENRVQKNIDIIYRQAYYDRLTKLPNRSSLLNRLDECIGKSIYLINIDDFTIINDFYGHKIGDKVLIRMSQILKIFCNDEDAEVYRLPSDEFAIISHHNQTKIEIENTIKRLLVLVETEKFLVDDFSLHVNVTISAAHLNKRLRGLSNADMALKKAKRSHKQYIIYNKELELSKEYEFNLNIANEIKRAIENDDIIPYFQPIFEIGTNKIEKYEALVRLRKKNGEILSPYFFLEISEKIKLYSKITEIMIDKTFHYFSKNRLKFSINLAFSDILNEQTREYLFEKINEYQIASQLTIEILETQEYSNETIISEFTQDVYRHGAFIAIDDFGSGFANFEHMTNIFCDYMKIDGSLIKNIHKNKNNRLIVETIVVFAQKLGKKTIAEFVHCEEVYKIVKEIGIDYTQGYYLGEPKENII